MKNELLDWCFSDYETWNSQVFFYYVDMTDIVQLIIFIEVIFGL